MFLISSIDLIKKMPKFPNELAQETLMNGHLGV